MKVLAFHSSRQYHYASTADSSNAAAWADLGLNPTASQPDSNRLCHAMVALANAGHDIKEPPTPECADCPTFQLLRNYAGAIADYGFDAWSGFGWFQQEFDNGERWTEADAVLAMEAHWRNVQGKYPEVVDYAGLAALNERITAEKKRPKLL